MTIVAIVSDAGVPESGKTYGFTWAYRHLGAGGLWAAPDAVVCESSGAVLAASLGMDVVENNLAETYALLMALEAAPAGWCGIVASDNQNALGRVFAGWRMMAVPLDVERRVRGLASHLDLAGCTPVLLQGHPTRAEIAARQGRSGRPTSPHNMWADQTCRAVALAMRATHRAKLDAQGD